MELVAVYVGVLGDAFLGRRRDGLLLKSGGFLYGVQDGYSTKDAAGSLQSAEHQRRTYDSKNKGSYKQVTSSKQRV